jgi:hypothetical protein
VRLGTKQGDVQQCVDVGAKREVEGFVGPIGSRALHESAGAWSRGFSTGMTRTRKCEACLYCLHAIANEA